MLCYHYVVMGFAELCGVMRSYAELCGFIIGLYAVVGLLV